MTLHLTEEEGNAWIVNGGKPSRNKASDSGPQRDASEPPVIHLTLSVGLYAVLIEELGFLRCVAGHEHNADVLRQTLYHAGGVKEVEKLS